MREELPETCERLPPKVDQYLQEEMRDFNRKRKPLNIRPISYRIEQSDLIDVGITFCLFAISSALCFAIGILVAGLALELWG